MDYVEKIRKAMQLLQEGCMMNEEWADCVRCPFDRYCDLLSVVKFPIPADKNFLLKGNEDD